jgi:RecA-family ATPase
VEGLIPLGAVTMLSGDGGLGKTLLAQQLMTACAIGRTWIGFGVLPCRSLGIFCEDDADEIHRRQVAINRHYGIGFEALTDMRWVSRVGEDNSLFAYASKGFGLGKELALLRQIEEAAVGFGVQLLELDSLHDLFSGNENHRGVARQFIGGLRRIALRIDGAVVLNAHPSLSGLNTGTGASGSTAWNNSARSRLYLKRPREDDAGDGNTRVLETMKANYAPTGGKIALEWRDGVLVPSDAVGTRPRNLVDTLATDAALLDGLRKLVREGTSVAADPSARNGFANILRKMEPTCRGLTFAECRDAQARLLAAGKIERFEQGPPSRRHVYIRPVEMGKGTPNTD